MSKISDMYEQIKLQQYTLIKTKLQEAVMARKEKRELSKEEKEDYTFTDDEVIILIKMLEEQGFTEGKNFINFLQSDYDSPDHSVFVIKIDGDYIGLSTHTWGGKDIPNITNIESIQEMIDGFEGVELEEDMLKVVSLTDIDLEQIQIGSSSRENEDSVEIAKNKAIDARENLVRAKLRETIKDMMVGKEQSSNNGLDRDNEIYVLLDMLKKAGFEEGKDFDFEDVAGVITEDGKTSMFAICTRYKSHPSLKTLPAGKYLCCNCDKENLDQTLNKMLNFAKDQYNVVPHFIIQIVVLIGILQWNYQLQLCLNK